MTLGTETGAEQALTSRELEERHTSGVYVKRDVTIVRGEGAYLWDDAGRRYIDCVGGQGSANLGHCHPRVVAAIREQSERLITCTELFYNDTRAGCLATLASVTPEGLDRIFLCNSGAESIESGLKFARMATGRTGVVATMRGFHGRTLGALSATWEQRYREMFEPLIPGFKHVPYDNLDALREAVTEETSAVVVEPVQGEGGVRPASREFLQGVEAICRERGAMFVLDEVQTGFGRTGAMFACQRLGVTPDILCLAKSIAGGVPMGAVALGPRVQGIVKASHSTTFGGNPLVCAASIAAIEALRDERLPERAAELGDYFMGRLRSLKAPVVREVRGLGLLVGVELRQKSAPYLRALMDRGVLALAAGQTVLRFLPPLVIERADLDFVVEQVAEVLAQPVARGGREE